MSDVQAWLDKLGAMSATDIRDLLAGSGINGQRREPYSCPIARLIRNETGCSISVGTLNTYAMNEEIVYDNPSSVVAFIRAFDRGTIPELESNLYR